MTEQIPEETYSSDVHVVELDNRKFILVGTAHISKESARLVREVIEKEQPDTVCVELDQQRYKSLAEQRKWENLDLKSVIRQKQLATLLINLLLASYQKRLGQQLGVQPGVELLEAVKAAEDNNIPIALCDRDIRVTLRRAWNSMTFVDKAKLLTAGFAGVFEKQEISEEQLAEIRQKDVLTELIAEMGKAMPTLKTVLIDERDSYLAQKIRDAKGNKIVAIVGAGHVQGMLETLKNHRTRDLAEIEKIPPMSPMWKVVGWGIPAIIIASIAYIGWSKGLGAAGDNALYWFLANGIPCAIGGIAALAHPLTIVTGFFAAPFTSLTPVIGAGYVCAFVQAYLQPPVVREFQTVSEHIAEPRNWWKNKLLRVFLVFILTSLGSLIGTYVGAYEIIRNLF